MSDLVGNPKDRLSRDAAHIIVTGTSVYSECISMQDLALLTEFYRRRDKVRI